MDYRHILYDFGKGRKVSLPYQKDKQHNRIESY